MDNNLFGGRLIATGSKSCIVNPNIKCRNNKYKRRNKKNISKIVFGDEALELSIEEKKTNDMIKRIPGYNKWALIFDHICQPPSYSESLKIEKDIHKCLNEEDTYTLHSGVESKKDELFDQKSIMLIGEYGGETFGDYFNRKFNDIDSVEDIEREFLLIMKKIKHIFKGLAHLQDYELSHLDIKQNNIVISKNNFKFIDFGLSSKFNNTIHFLERSYHEFKTSRIYYWYPFEYIYAYATNEELDTEEKLITEYGIRDYRRHMDILYDIYSIFGIDIEIYVKDLIKKYKGMDKKAFYSGEFYNVIKGIDTYSFGMLIPFMLYNQGILENAHKSIMLTEFLNVFALMIEPRYQDRIDIHEASEIFDKLLQKYSKKKKRSKRKKKSKRKSRSKKR